MIPKTLIYIGNKLSNFGYTPTSIETLGERLKELINVSQYSDRKNYLRRMLHMWRGVLNASRDSIVFIDTYSSNAFHFAWTSALVAQIKKTPYVPILRGGDLPNRMDTSPLLSRFFFKNAIFIVSPSGFLKSEVEKRFNVHVSIIPNYIDLKKYPYESKSFSTIRLLWVRSFHKTYNPLMAVHVLRALHDSGYINSQLCMIGPDKDGSRTEVAKLAQKLEVDHALELTGKLSKKSWIEKSKKFNIFINTTNFDNTPVSVMEAMALGFPVITTNVGGIPYLFKDRAEGIMIEKNNPSMMVNAILKIFNEKDRAIKLSLNARKKAESWDWEIVKQKWSDLINQIQTVSNK